MADFTRESEIVVTCPKNISSILALEIQQLGYTVIQTEAAFVKIKGSLNDCIRLNMWLRTAHKVLYKVWGIRANDAEQLYREVNNAPWEHFIPSDGYFTVTSQVFNDNIRDTRFANLKVKDAIADRIKGKKGERPDSGPEKDGCVVFLHWEKSEGAVFIDTSGQTIAKHGYRKLPGKAPMQETLAAAVVLSSKWEPGKNFYNPMCGSGTLAIEAALIASNKAPGLFREDYCFKHLIGYNSREWERLRKEALMKLKLPKGKFILSDIDAEAVAIAKKNATTAGLDKIMEFIQSDFRDLDMPENDGGIVIFNPEYGERLGEEEELMATYKEIGDFFKKKCKGYTGYVFTGSIDLAKSIGLKTKRRIPFFNGKIECRLMEFELYEGTRRVS